MKAIYFIFLFSAPWLYFRWPLLILSLLLANNNFSYAEVKMDLKELKQKLSPKEFEIMCNEGTEPAFQNEYWNHKEPGIYVDKITGEALFSSLDKYDSGTGWPSFTKPISDNQLKLTTDFKLIYPRTEVKSSSSGAHLGHVFDDGPSDRGGKRYCMNSASLKFIHKNDLDKSGYGRFKSMFE
jgi:methionine-R-sulfoxide reductase